MPAPNILVSNDDGVQAPGIAALVAELRRANVANVHVVAPAAEQSATSHALTLGKPLIVEHKCLDGIESCIAVHGTPADSVMLALSPDVLADVLKVTKPTYILQND